MNVLRAYLRTLVQYWHHPKGRRDMKDYAGAVLLIAATAAAVTAGAVLLNP